MRIVPFNNKTKSFKSWYDILNNCDVNVTLKSIVTGSVLLNFKGAINPNHPFAGLLSDDYFYAPVLAHILSHEKYGDFLIDAGLDKSYYKNKYGLFKGSLLQKYGSEFKQKLNQDTEYYIKKHDINLSGIFLTHLHMDHISAIRDLDDIPVYFSNKEKSMDIKPYYYAQYFKDISTINILNIDNTVETPILGKCINIFNDNSFWAIDTPGHTSGHLSYLVNSKEETILLTGDACYIYDNIKLKIAPSDYMWNISKAQKSLEKLLKFNDKYKLTKIIPGHDI
ncbi:MAG: MBL fold metallo-hydrolase [Methanobacteriaceae archaeon]|nr:MBL fold metallo-hydrolase [Methanobacteriaceae archaeon]